MAIYLTCAGSSGANGIYDQISSTLYERRDTGGSGPQWSIYFSVDRWIVNDGTYDYYYLLESSGSSSGLTDYEVESDTSWTLMGEGTGPVPKSFRYVFDDTNSSNELVYTTIIVAGAGTTAINGTYTHPVSSLIINGNNMGFGWVHSNNSYAIVSSMNGWEIWGTDGALYYTSSGGNLSELPLTEYDSGMTFAMGGSGFLGDSPEPTSSLDTTNICAAPAISSGFFIYRANNNDYIYNSGNNFYIRKNIS